MIVVINTGGKNAGTVTDGFVLFCFVSKRTAVAGRIRVYLIALSRPLSF